MERSDSPRSSLVCLRKRRASSCTSSWLTCSGQNSPLHQRSHHEDNLTLCIQSRNFFGFGCLDVSTVSTNWCTSVHTTTRALLWFRQHIFLQVLSPKRATMSNTNVRFSLPGGETLRRHLFKIHLAFQRCQASKPQTWYPSKQAQGQYFATAKTPVWGDQMRIPYHSEQEVMSTLCWTSRSAS